MFRHRPGGAVDDALSPAGMSPRPPEWGALLRRIERRLAELGVEIPARFDLDEFVAELERARGRPIVLHVFRQAPGADTVCGYTIMWPAYDAVCYQESLSDRSSTHYAVHEIGHLVLNHRSGLGPGWSATTPTAGMDPVEESEADAFAAVVLGRWDAPPPPDWSAWWALERTAARVHDAFR